MIIEFLRLPCIAIGVYLLIAWVLMFWYGRK